jgi:hypothetical protein
MKKRALTNARLRKFRLLNMARDEPLTTFRSERAARQEAYGDSCIFTEDRLVIAAYL